MAYNTIEEIKSELLLEDENQTLSDQAIQSKINDANRELVSLIGRSVEYDSFIAEESGTVMVTPFFSIFKVISVKVNNVEADSDDWEVVYEGDGISIDNINKGDEIHVISIPPNYKMLERAICIVSIRSRLNPFENNTVNPIYSEWKEKKTDFLKAIRRKFGASAYNG